MSDSPAWRVSGRSVRGRRAAGLVPAARALVVAALPAIASALTWARMEDEPAQRGRIGALVALGLLPALLPSVRWRLAATAVGVVLAASLAFAAWPGGEGDWPGDLFASAGRGLREFDVVALPFDAVARPEMHGLVLLAAFGFSAAAAFAASARWALACSAVALVGVGWPATTTPGRDTIGVGALALAAALWPPVVSRLQAPRWSAPSLASLAVVVALATAAASAGAKPSSAALAWQRWDVFGEGRSATGVTFIWDANYGGIAFPARKTTVLRIRAPRRALYWRASTLDLFVQDRWIENLYPVLVGETGRRLPADGLLPPAAGAGSGWVKQEVEVAALVDDHVVAASQPTRVESGDVKQLFFLSGGVMRAGRGLQRGQRYVAWSYAPRPSPRELLRSPPTYPAAVRRYLELDRTSLPPFGAAGRTRSVENVFRSELYQPLWPYRGVWRQAQRLAATARTPYEATVAVERWLRSDGGFTYAERPPQPLGLPPLADFVERSKQGYCQQFAGTMALMLRLLGVPARVAVGFTSGSWDEGVWTVTDHEAHAWVEVWFAGVGWLPFDPTPGRGTLSASYTLASDSADAVADLGTGRFLDFTGQGGSAGAPAPVTRLVPAQDRVVWPYLVAAALSGALLCLLGIVKWVRRRVRYATREPRLLAGAARAEVVDFLRDQGVVLRPHAGTRELRAAFERLGVAAGAFADSFDRARYGPLDRNAAEQARRDARALLCALRRRLGPGRRLRGYLTLRSLRRA